MGTSLVRVMMRPRMTVVRTVQSSTMTRPRPTVVSTVCSPPRTPAGKVPVSWLKFFWEFQPPICCEWRKGFEDLVSADLQQSESRARKDTAARMPQGEVIEFNFKSPVPAGFKSPAQKRLESRAQETYSPKSFAEIQAQLENADVNRKVPNPEFTDFEMTGCL